MLGAGDRISGVPAEGMDIRLSETSVVKPRDNGAENPEAFQTNIRT